MQILLHQKTNNLRFIISIPLYHWVAFFQLFFDRYCYFYHCCNIEFDPSQHPAAKRTMTSWSKDEDKHRLPEGMLRVGYDADTSRYHFKDKKDGSIWEGPEGSKYGKLRRSK